MTAITPTKPKSDVTLPMVTNVTGPMLTALTEALSVPREILAADDQIEHAWSNLPKLLSRIPPEKRSETLARMCVAISAGLFDAAVNYAWNAAVIELRSKVRHFGLSVVHEVINKQFDEVALRELQDAELLQICLQLNLITEEGFFLLDQCRDIRNNFSAAHPAMGSLDEHEFLAFLNRCAKHALSNESNPKGVDIKGMIAALKGGAFTGMQVTAWKSRLGETFDAQRERLFVMLHGIYCDPTSNEPTRLNAEQIATHFASSFSDRTKSDLLDQHHDYGAKGDDGRHKSSLLFFERLGLLALVGDVELHALITSAAKKLLTVHSGYNNFHNEPPFAERLASISAQNKIPETAQATYVEAVITCATGNPWGVSHAAMAYYEKMIAGFSPIEMRLMLELSNSQTIVGARIKSQSGCKARYATLVASLNEKSVPNSVKTLYASWKAEAEKE